MAQGELPRFDETAWPMVLIEMPRSMNMVTIESIIAGFESLHARDERFIIVVDCSPVTRFPGAAERRRLLDWMKHEAQFARERRHTIGSAVVLTSGPMRALLSAMNWVHRPAAPQEWTATLGEAVDWSCERLVEAGIAITPAIAALRAQSKRRDLDARRAR
jgi:hypothetical protein